MNEMTLYKKLNIIITKLLEVQLVIDRLERIQKENTRLRAELESLRAELESLKVELATLKVSYH